MSEKIFLRAAFELPPLCGCMAASSVLCLWPCPGGIYICRPCLCGWQLWVRVRGPGGVLFWFCFTAAWPGASHFFDFKSHLCKMGRKRGSSFLRRIVCQRAVSNFWAMIHETNVGEFCFYWWNKQTVVLSGGFGCHAMVARFWGKLVWKNEPIM